MKNYSAYFTIVQKIIGLKHPKYIEEYDSKTRLRKEKMMYFLEGILVDEWKHRNKAIDQQVAILLLFMIHIMQRNSFMTKSLLIFVRQKINYVIHNIQNNPFLTPTQKELFMDLYSQIQKHYLAFVKFIHIVKMKKAKLQNDSDLLLNTIDLSKPNNYVIVFHSNAKYLFSIRDMIRLLMNSLTNAYRFEIETYCIKNPYNNIEFTITNLYNIYFALKRSGYLIPALIDKYFLSHFVLENFETQNQDEILKQIIYNKTYKSPPITIQQDILNMLDIYSTKLSMDQHFPADVLADAMRPFLLLYYYICNASSDEKKLETKRILRTGLLKFAKKNTMFGRKIFSIKTKDFSYNTEFIPFGKIQ